MLNQDNKPANQATCYNNSSVFLYKLGGRTMEVKTTQFKHCDVVKVIGRVDSSTSPKLAEELFRINDSGRYKIVMDFADVEFISSAGLRVLIATLKTCKRYNRGDLILAALPENIKSVFELAGFTAIFKIHDDVLSAVGSI